MDVSVAEHGEHLGAAPRGDAPHLTGAVLRDRREVDVLAGHRDPACVEARQVEQVCCELGEAVDLLAHRGEEPVARRRVGVVLRRQLEEAAERRERRAQLVRGVRDERSPGILETAELDTHHIERAGEVGDLIAPVVDHRIVEGAPGQPFCGALETSQATGQRVRACNREQGGGGDRDRPSGQDPALDERHRARQVVDRGREHDEERDAAIGQEVGDLGRAAATDASKARDDPVLRGSEPRDEWRSSRPHRPRVGPRRQALPRYLPDGYTSAGRVRDKLDGSECARAEQTTALVREEPDRERRPRLLVELSEALALEVALQRRHDEQVHRGDRHDAGRDGNEGNAYVEAAKAPQERPRHRYPRKR